ncbi:MAG: LysM peptidoglycan-binding domain-containing protein [Alphaproteobacteria bacterium]
MKKVILILFLSFIPHFAQADITVQQGETLYSLSKKHNLSLQDFARENNLSSPYALKIGQTLKLPETKVFSSDKGIATVKKGETLSSISKRTGVSKSILIEANALLDPFSLREGQMLYLKKRTILRNVKKPVENKAFRKRHIVKAGDTLFSISRKHNISVAKIKKFNGLIDSNLKIGQRLVLSSPLVSDVKVRQKTSFHKIKTALSESRINLMRPVKFSSPLSGKIISSFGMKANGLKNEGVNIEASKGASVSAMEKALVFYAGNGIKGFGNTLVLQHSLGYTTIYAHLDQIFVGYGDVVDKGEKIATVGYSGKVKSPQLHLEIRKEMKSINPEKILEF